MIAVASGTLDVIGEKMKSIQLAANPDSRSDTSIHMIANTTDSSSTECASIKNPMRGVLKPNKSWT